MDDQAQQRDAEAEAREAALDARERRIRNREAADGDRAEERQHILDDADERDERADLRDRAAAKRDEAASLAAFLNESDGSAGLKARRSAGLDRADAKSDRTLSAEDRERLAPPGKTEEPPPSD